MINVEWIYHNFMALFFPTKLYIKLQNENSKLISGKCTILLSLSERKQNNKKATEELVVACRCTYKHTSSNRSVLNNTRHQTFQWKSRRLLKMHSNFCLLFNESFNSTPILQLRETALEVWWVSAHRGELDRRKTNTNSWSKNVQKSLNIGKN